MRGHLPDRHSGRYLSLLLRELGRHEPGSFARLVMGLRNQGVEVPQEVVKEIRHGRAQFEREWSYCDGRRADLVVLVQGEPAIVLEVKEDDVAALGNGPQLDDYLRFVTAPPAGTAIQPVFIHLSRYRPSDAAMAKLAAAAHAFDIRYAHVLRALAGPMASPIARMVADYLEDIGVDAYRTLAVEDDGAALALMVRQILGMNGRNMGKMHSNAAVERVPHLMEILLANVSVLG